MAFTGAAVQVVVADDLVRITGLSLAAGAAGTIGLNGDATADVELPDDFNPTPYGAITLSDAIQCYAVPIDAQSAAGGSSPLITKAEGPFQITITNQDGATASSEFEIWVRFH
jgi:hypothetical protein